MAHENAGRPRTTRNIYLYKAGDATYSGLRMPVNTRRYRNLDALLDELSLKVPGLPYGVRRLMTPKGKHEVKNIEQLQHMGSYVCTDKIEKRSKIGSVNVERFHAQDWKRRQDARYAEKASSRIPEPQKPKSPTELTKSGSLPDIAVDTHILDDPQAIKSARIKPKKKKKAKLDKSKMSAKLAESLEGASSKPSAKRTKTQRTKKGKKRRPPKKRVRSADPILQQIREDEEPEPKPEPEPILLPKPPRGKKPPKKPKKAFNREESPPPSDRRAKSVARDVPRLISPDRDPSPEPILTQRNKRAVSTKSKRKKSKSPRRKSPKSPSPPSMQEKQESRKKSRKPSRSPKRKESPIVSDTDMDDVLDSEEIYDLRRRRNSAPLSESLASTDRLSIETLSPLDLKKMPHKQRIRLASRTTRREVESDYSSEVSTARSSKSKKGKKSREEFQRQETDYFDSGSNKVPDKNETPSSHVSIDPIVVNSRKPSMVNNDGIEVVLTRAETIEDLLTEIVQLESKIETMNAVGDKKAEENRSSLLVDIPEVEPETSYESEAHPVEPDIEASTAHGPISNDEDDSDSDTELDVTSSSGYTTDDEDDNSRPESEIKGKHDRRPSGVSSAMGITVTMHDSERERSRSRTPSQNSRRSHHSRGRSKSPQEKRSSHRSSDSRRNSRSRSRGRADRSTSRGRQGSGANPAPITTAESDYTLPGMSDDSAASKIQAGFRGMRTRKELKKQHDAATKIQSNFRGFRTRKSDTRRSKSDSAGSLSPSSVGGEDPWTGATSPSRESTDLDTIVEKASDGQANSSADSGMTSELQFPEIKKAKAQRRQAGGSWSVYPFVAHIWDFWTRNGWNPF